MNDVNYKKESLSAVMRAFMLEHEIAHGQQIIYFVGGSSLLLRRYCSTGEVCTDVFLSRPGLRSHLFRSLTAPSRMKRIIERVGPNLSEPQS
jgi:hypothetical protein